MSSLYPGAKQTFTNPVGTNTLDTPNHALMHGTVNDTLGSIQDTVGTNSGTNVLMHFTAGQFAVRATGVSATGTLVQTLVGGTLNSQTVGTPAITGGTMTTPVITGPTLTYTTDTDAGTVTFDLTAGPIHTVTLAGNRTLATSNSAAGKAFVVNLVQDATGTRTVTWFSTIKWPGGVTPTLTVTAAKTDSFGFITTSAGNYLGYIVGQNL